jgi:hemerythrin
MTLLPCKDAYSLAIDPVDRDHRALIDLIDRLHGELDAAAARAPPAAIAALLESISAHLALEIAVMQDHGYEELAAHKADHERLIDNMCDLIVMHAFERPDEPESSALAERLDAWLCEHFGTHDSRRQQALAAGLP